MIRILLAEDSPTVAEVFRALLAGDPELSLAGLARDGAEAMALLPRLRPDLLVTDLHMPRVDGLELIRWAMAEHPLPILVLSNTAREDGSALAFQCLAAGAVEIGPKPRGGEHRDRDQADLLRLIKVLAGVRVVGRRPSAPALATARAAGPRAVGIAASTGGPQALARIFQDLGGHFPVPLLVVQHIQDGFLDGLLRWLGETTPVPALAAAPGIWPQPGCAYFAPAGAHLVLAPDGSLALQPGRAGELHLPSADRLFHSMADVLGPEACGLLLTGMGRDGAEGLLAMRRAGASTVAQAEAGCLIYGMPKAAAELGAAGSILELGFIPAFLNSLCH